MTVQSFLDWEESGILALFRSPFLIPSVIFHGVLVLLALRAATLTLVKPDETPISVQLLEVRDGGWSNKSIGPGSGPGGPRSMPKLGTPLPPAQRRGKLESGSLETLAPAETEREAALPKQATLPGPKALATPTRPDTINVNETSPDSLVRLPTKASPTQLPGSAAADLAANERSVALRDSGESAGIKALKEGTQIPGALKGSGSMAGPYGMPGGSRTGSGISGAGSGTG